MNTIHLIAIGEVKAIPVAELQIGMRTMWNYGYTSDVVAIAPKGRDSLSVTLRSNRTGDEAPRHLRKGTLVAAFWPKQKMAFPNDYNWICPICRRECRKPYCEHEAERG